MQLSRIFYNLTESWKSNMATSDPNRKYHISACRYDISNIPMAIAMFSRSSYPMGLEEMLYNLSGGGKSNMAAPRARRTVLDVPMSQLVDMIGASFRRLNSCFRVQLFDDDIFVLTKRK